MLISQAFDERGRVASGLYTRLLHGMLEVNRGMLVENVAAQMLTTSRHHLYFYATPSKKDAAEHVETVSPISKLCPRTSATSVRSK